ncbi:MAG: ABC transporter permease [bacterium]|nr:ABC transporter permease [bacterium]
MTTLIQDIRYGVRMLVNSRMVTVMAVIALALGIGANCAIFTVVNSVLLQPLPYPDADRLFLATRQFHPSGRSSSISVPKADYWRRHNRVFESMATYDRLGAGYNLTGVGEAERVRGSRASADFFKVLKVEPTLGRGFLPEDDRPGTERVVVLSHGLWQRRFGGDPGVLGTNLTFSAQNYTVIGVMPADFRTEPEAEMWTSLQAKVTADDPAHYLFCLGRLKPGVTPEQAQADMERVARQFQQEFPKTMNDKESITVVSLQEELVGDVRPALLVLLGAVGCVLLIACANVANLLLARAATRTREIALRISLGAGRFRLIRQLLTESALLALAGGAVGLLLGDLGIRALLAVSPTEVPLVNIGMDNQVLAFTLAVSLLTGVVFGLAPALQVTKPNLSGTLKEGSRGSTVGRRRRYLRGALVVGEIALALVLMIGAGLLTETFVGLRSVDPGFDPHNVLTMQMSLAGSRYANTAGVDGFYRQVLRRLESLPGVLAAATVTNLPMEKGSDVRCTIEGRPDTGGYVGGQWRHITSNYFDVMKIPLRRGRSFTERDTGNSPPVLIVNQAFVRRYFPEEEPLGQRVTIGRNMGPQFADQTRQIVGVVGDVREFGLDRNAPPAMFLPASQVPSGITAFIARVMPTTWVVRTAGEPLSMRELVQREIRAVDSQQPVSSIRKLEQVVGASIASQNFNMLLLGVFAGIAVLLAAVGIYGVMAYTVTERTQEFGIRMALGAARGDVARMVLKQGMSLAAAGVLLGLAGAFGLTRLLSSLLFGVTPTDPITYATVAALLTLIALVAIYVPARRATRVDPIVALRYE